MPGMQLEGVLDSGARNREWCRRVPGIEPGVEPEVVESGVQLARKFALLTTYT